MPKEILVYKGWIGAKESDHEVLLDLGVNVGQWNPIGTFDFCSMTADVYDRFVRKWSGYRVYGLIGRKEIVYSQEEMDDVPF